MTIFSIEIFLNHGMLLHSRGAYQEILFFLLRLLFFPQHVFFILLTTTWKLYKFWIVVHRIKFSYQPNFTKVSHKFLFFVVAFSLKTVPPHREATKKNGPKFHQPKKILLKGSLCPAKTKRIPTQLMRRRLKRTWWNAAVDCFAD